MVGIVLGCQANAWQREFAIRDDMDRALGQLRAAGYVGAEIGAGFFTSLDDGAWLKDLLAKHRLRYAAIHLGGVMYDRSVQRERTLPAIRQAARFARQAGAEGALISTGAKREGPLTAEEHAANIDGLKEAAHILREHGLPAYYHNHAYEFADGARVLQSILDGVPADLLNLAFDTANASQDIPAAQVPEVIRRFASRIGYLHYKDHRGGTLVEALGEGEIDFAAVGRVVREIGYAGWVVAEIEQGPGMVATRPVAEDARRSYDLLRRTLGELA